MRSSRSRARGSSPSKARCRGVRWSGPCRRWTLLIVSTSSRCRKKQGRSEASSKVGARSRGRTSVSRRTTPSVGARSRGRTSVSRRATPSVGARSRGRTSASRRTNPMRQTPLRCAGSPAGAGSYISPGFARLAPNGRTRIDQDKPPACQFRRNRHGVRRCPASSQRYPGARSAMANGASRAYTSVSHIHLRNMIRA
jgi:hypothetical protein